MKKFSTWMILSLDVMFWVFRVIAAYTYSMGINFMIVPMDLVTEITVIFIALLSFIFIAKRMVIGPIIYCIAQFGYFGVYLWNTLIPAESEGITLDNYMSVFFSFIGIVLSLFTLLDLILDKNRKLRPRDKKTDWFYTNKEYDMKKDEREDKNNYRTL